MQLAMGMVVNFFFSGFVLGKIPFPLSPRFKLMLQRGLDLVSLDVSYFTSLSFYILLLFGLRGVFSLIFRCDRGVTSVTGASQGWDRGGAGQYTLTCLVRGLNAAALALGDTGHAVHAQLDKVAGQHESQCRRHVYDMTLNRAVCQHQSADTKHAWRHAWALLQGLCG
jgi:hypothetical protein